MRGTRCSVFYFNRIGDSRFITEPPEMVASQLAVP